MGMQVRWLSPLLVLLLVLLALHRIAESAGAMKAMMLAAEGAVRAKKEHRRADPTNHRILNRGSTAWSPIHQLGWTDGTFAVTRGDHRENFQKQRREKH